MRVSRSKKFQRGARLNPRSNPLCRAGISFGGPDNLLSGCATRTGSEEPLSVPHPPRFPLPFLVPKLLLGTPLSPQLHCSARDRQWSWLSNPVPKRSPQSSHGIENQGCIQRSGGFDFGPIEFEDIWLSHRNSVLLIALSFVPGGTTESSPALQCRVPAPPAVRPGGTLEAPCTCAHGGQPMLRPSCPSLPEVASCAAPQASLRDAPPFHHQPGTEVPGYFQPSLPGRRGPRVPDVLWDGSEWSLGTRGSRTQGA